MNTVKLDDKTTAIIPESWEVHLEYSHDPAFRDAIGLASIALIKDTADTFGISLLIFTPDQIDLLFLGLSFLGVTVTTLDEPLEQFFKIYCSIYGYGPDEDPSEIGLDINKVEKCMIAGYEAYFMSNRVDIRVAESILLIINPETRRTVFVDIIGLPDELENARVEIDGILRSLSFK